MRSIVILGAALMAGACTGDGSDEPAARRDFQATAFDRVALRGSQDVIVTVGGAHSVRAEGSERRLERLEIEVVDGELRISSRSSSGWFHGGGATIHVTVPALVGASVAGSGDMRVDRVAGDRFEAAVSGSGELDIADLRVEEARFAIAGSGEIAASGAARRTEATVAGSGDLDLERFETAAARIVLAGSGNAIMRATETAEVELRGSGNVRVTGPARCRVDKRGSGDVRCGD